MSYIYIIFILLELGFLSVSCRSHPLQSSQGYSLIRVSDSLYYVQYATDTTVNRWKLPYPVYRFDTGDIDGDGMENALVGVVKTTRFDPQMGRRLFIFKTYRGYVRPLWLGSRLGYPIEDFRFVTIDGEPCIRSLERERSGNYLISEYRWHSFGFEFVLYRGREMSRSDALAFFNENESNSF